MDKQETLGLEKLGLEGSAAPWNTTCANKAKGRRAEPKAPLLSALQQASGQHTSSIGPWDPSAVPSYQTLPIAPLGGSASTDTLNPLPSQLYHHGLGQSCHAGRLGFTAINGPSTVPRVTALQSMQPRRSCRGPEPTVQKSTLYSKANPRLTEDTPVQRGKWTGSPPAGFRKALSQPSIYSQSTKTSDREATLPAAREPSPSILNNKDDMIYLPAPTPTSAYLSDAHVIPKLLPSPQRLLLVLDLNGTLLYRSRASQDYTPRPCLHKFLKYAFANHSLLVWSSAQPYNVKGVCTRLFTPDQRRLLLGQWGRDTLGLTSVQYKKRVQVYKRLDRIWGDENLQRSHPDFEEGERWGQSNTVLIDDSAQKASAQPFNHVEVPEFVRGGSEKEGDGRDVLGQVMGYLEEARKWNDVSGFVMHGPFEIDAGWRWRWQNEKPHGRSQCEDDDDGGGVRL